MSDIGYATMPVIPSVKGLSGQIQRQLSGVGASAGQATSKGFASRFVGGAASAMTSLVKTGTKTGALIGAAIGGVALKKGFDRLSALEEADKRLSSMGLSATQTGKLMGSLNDILTGTPFALDAGATAMAGFVSAGVDAGKIPGILKSVTDAAAFGQADLGEVADIFQKVSLNGKATTEMLNQLQYRGIPATALLASSLGKTGEELSSFVSDGELSADLFFSAWEDGAKGFGDQNIMMAGAAMSAGDTVKGAWANMITSLARGGARVLGPVFGGIRNGLTSLTGFFDSVGKSVGDLVTWFAVMPATRGIIEDISAGAGRAALRFAAWLGSISPQQVASFSEAIGRMWDGLKAGLSTVSDLGARLRTLFSGDAIQQGAADRFQTLSDAVAKIATAAVEAWPAVQTIGTELARATAQVGVGTWDLFVASLEVLSILATTVLVPALEQLAAFMEAHPGAVTAVVAAYTAWKLGSVGVQAAKTASQLGGLTKRVTTFFKAGQDGYSGLDRMRLGMMRVSDAGGKMRTGIGRAASALKSGATSAAAWTRAMVLSAAATARNTAAAVLARTKQLALAAAQKAAAVVQWALNAAMSANPITLVVIAIAALVAGLVWAYKNVGWFRDAVDAMGRGVAAAFGWVVDAAKAVWDWISTNWPTLLAILTGPIGLAVLLITRNWDTIKKAFTAVKDWIGARVTDIVRFITGLPGRIASTVSSLWTGLRNKTTEVKTWVGNRITDIVGFVTGIPGRIGGTVSRLWQGITFGISAAKDWVGLRVDDVVSFISNMPWRISAAASGMWDGIKNAFKSALNWIIRKWNGLSFTLPGFSAFGVSIGGSTIPTPNIEEFHTGGTVDGRLTGDEVVAKLLRSETVLTADQMRRVAAGVSSGGGGVVIHQTFNGPVTRDDARWVADAMRKAQQQGHLPRAS